MKKSIMFLVLVVVICSCGNISTNFKDDTKVSISTQEKVNEQYKAIRSFVGDSTVLNDVYIVNKTDDIFYAYLIGIDKPIPMYKISLEDNAWLELVLGIVLGIIVTLFIEALINI